MGLEYQKTKKKKKKIDAQFHLECSQRLQMPFSLHFHVYQTAWGERDFKIIWHICSFETFVEGQGHTSRPGHKMVIGWSKYYKLKVSVLCL